MPTTAKKFFELDFANAAIAAHLTPRELLASFSLTCREVRAACKRHAPLRAGSAWVAARDVGWQKVTQVSVGANLNMVPAPLPYHSLRRIEWQGTPAMTAALAAAACVENPLRFPLLEALCLTVDVPTSVLMTFWKMLEERRLVLPSLRVFEFNRNTLATTNSARNADVCEQQPSHPVFTTARIWSPWFLPKLASPLLKLEDLRLDDVLDNIAVVQLARNTLTELDLIRARWHVVAMALAEDDGAWPMSLAEDDGAWPVLRGCTFPLLPSSSKHPLRFLAPRLERVGLTLALPLSALAVPNSNLAAMFPASDKLRQLDLSIDPSPGWPMADPLPCSQLNCSAFTSVTAMTVLFNGPREWSAVTALPPHLVELEVEHANWERGCCEAYDESKEAVDLARSSDMLAQQVAGGNQLRCDRLRKLTVTGCAKVVLQLIAPALKELCVRWDPCAAEEFPMSMRTWLAMHTDMQLEHFHMTADALPAWGLDFVTHWQPCDFVTCFSDKAEARKLVEAKALREVVCGTPQPLACLLARLVALRPDVRFVY